MTFKEFMSRQDMPNRIGLKPQFSGIQVVKQFADDATKIPDLSKSRANLISKPSLGMATRSTDRAIPNKPHRFLPRKSSSLRKGF